MLGKVRFSPRLLTFHVIRRMGKWRYLPRSYIKLNGQLYLAGSATPSSTGQKTTRATESVYQLLAHSVMTGPIEPAEGIPADIFSSKALDF